MRALTLTQPWAGLVASGIKLVENRPRSIVKPADFGAPFAIHASRQIDESVYGRIADIAPELQAEISGIAESLWYPLSRITGAVIGVATIDKAFTGGWDAKAIAKHAAALSFSNGGPLGPSQVRWFFGPVGYVLRDARARDAGPVPRPPGILDAAAPPRTRGQRAAGGALMAAEHRHPRCATSCYVTPASAPSDANEERRREIAARDQRIAELERELAERAAGGRP